MSQPPPKRIIHLDMDAFYASVESLDNPALKGRPIIVGGLTGRGVVSTASYEARELGVHSGLPMVAARRLCPDGVYIQPRHQRYQEISGRIMAIFSRYTPLVEPLALDEAFLDVTGSVRLFGPAESLAGRLKEEVRAETGLTVSAGVASQKHLAKIASGLNKPDGLTLVAAGRELDFLWPLPLAKLWGVGQVRLGQLRELGLVTVGDLARLERIFLEKRFGRSGGQLWDLANGLDVREVVAEYEAKSVGSEETFAVDLTGPEEIRAALLAQTLTAVDRMRRQGLTAATITVKFRDSRFKTRTRAVSLPRPTDRREKIYQAVLTVYEKEAGDLKALRLVGVSLSRLSRTDGLSQPARPQQGSLLEAEATDEKSAKLNQALDQLADRFGAGAVKPATLAGREG
jgi:DNA polymerase-4